MTGMNTIRNVEELECVIFCIENVAEKLSVDAEKVYDAWTKKTVF